MLTNWHALVEIALRTSVIYVLVIVGIHQHVSEDELEQALREHGCYGCEDVALAVLAVDGAISVLKYDDVQEHHRPQRRLRFLHKH